jgi:hypothetical protein
MMDFDDDDPEEPIAPLVTTTTTNEQLDKVVKETLSQTATETKPAEPAVSPVKREPAKKFDMSKLKEFKFIKTFKNNFHTSIDRSSILNYHPEQPIMSTRTQKPGINEVKPAPPRSQHQQQQDDEHEMNLFGPPVRTNMGAVEGPQVVRLGMLSKKTDSVDDGGNAYNIDEVENEMQMFAEATGMAMFDGLGGFPKIPEKLPQLLLQPVQPCFQPPSSPFQQQQQQQQPPQQQREPINDRLLYELNHIFEFPCCAYLLDKCMDGHKCRFNHALPDDYRVKAKLFSLPHDVLLSSYTFVEERHILFNKYFRVYCEVFGRRKMRKELICMIPDCEKPHRDVFCYHQIVEGLMFSELDRTTAVQIIIDKHQKRVFKTVDVLIELICKCGNDVPKFINDLQFFAGIDNYQIQNSSIERLIGIGQSTGNVELISFVTAQLLAADASKLSSANKDLIMQFLNMVNDMGIDPNFSELLMKIMHKLP